MATSMDAPGCDFLMLGQREMDCLTLENSGTEDERIEAIIARWPKEREKKAA